MTAAAERPAALFIAEDVGGIAQQLGLAPAGGVGLAGLVAALNETFSAALDSREAEFAARVRRPQGGRHRKPWRAGLDDDLQRLFRETFARSPCGSETSRRLAAAWVRALCMVALRRADTAGARDALKELNSLSEQTIITYLRRAARRRCSEAQSFAA